MARRQDFQRAVGFAPRPHRYSRERPRSVRQPRPQQLLPANRKELNFSYFRPKLLLYFRDTQIFTDLLCQLVGNFIVPWHRRSAIMLRMVPPRMSTAFTQQLTTVGS